MWYGYVAYFSAFDAEEVLQQSGKMIIGGNRIKLKKKYKSNHHASHGLSLHKSQEVLMHYFGFNCWTSEIVYVMIIKVFHVLIHCMNRRCKKILGQGYIT